ncbi:aldehyde dehydrogenase [Grosmannia clavigera kw1407]|uniref:Aldehyde dehydrogenase n=1 Tax=Grosmannia clavigera (strain kw1407 / UAMH 11150) TaxID=655863 RepID=F0XIP3_GROCL|nr:aldehyde dehydrogenase [Grosmannia clavigera kw1407]EFX02135.1 aldehyde dehydrogenase [Grosmannia clavigera kw1407]
MEPTVEHHADGGHHISHIVEHIAIDAGSKSHHGLGLWPPPSSDPRDPLRWPRSGKLLALVVTTFFNFVGNFANAGLSVATVLLEMQFHKSGQEINKLLTFNFLLLGIGNLVWVPLSVKFGKRPMLLISSTIMFATLLWAAKATTFNQLLASRCILGFASAAGESILPGIVSDMFFLHERGAMMAIYVIFISCGSAVGPLIAGFVVQDSPGTWRDYEWVSASLAGFTLVAIFFFYPESSFIRPSTDEDTPSGSFDLASDPAKKEELDGMSSRVENAVPAAAAVAVGTVPVVPISYPRVWTSFFKINPLVRLHRAFAMPFAFVLCVPVLWTIFIYGSSLAAQVIMIFSFPSLLLAPPYLFAASSVGLMQIAALIGFVFACYGGGYISDVITARLIIRNRGTFVPEQRLVSILPGCFIGPAGCILIAFACDRSLHWSAIAVGFGMVSFGTVYAPNIAMTYLLDCYPEFSQEILVAVNVVKNLVAFLFLYVAVDWIKSQGWIQVYMIMFMVVTLPLLLAIPLYYFGRRAREAFDPNHGAISSSSPRAQSFVWFVTALPTGARPTSSKVEFVEYVEQIETAEQDDVVEHAIPLVLHGETVLNELDSSRRHLLPGGYFQGADVDDCQRAIESSAAAFETWSHESPIARRQLLMKLAALLRERGDEAKALTQAEIHCSELWADINLQGSIGLIEETAAMLTSTAVRGSMPHTAAPGSYGMVFTRPLGIVVGIAPWNAPLLLGFRAVVAPVAAGNTAILKGSELSPRTHYFIANLFVEAGFPAGVVNFVLHRPEDASDVVDVLIKHPAVRKINFTGSTAVGRIVAQKAGQALKPNGQICMSTDLVVVVRAVADAFKAELQKALRQIDGTSWTVISPRSAAKLEGLVADAVSKGATVLSTATAGSRSGLPPPPQDLPFRLVEDLTPAMHYFAEESFGPMLGLVVVEDEAAAERVVNASEYGLSAAVWSRNHHRALELARRLDVGAVHINAPTVHDEATLPHGGSKSSGFGRFGAEWGLLEFSQSQTVILHA